MKENSKNFSRLGAVRWVLAPIAIAALAACGGSSDDGPEPTPPGVKHIVEGQVAVGALVSGATVNITCATGGSLAPATTNATGNYQIDISNDAVRPCVGISTLPSGSTLRSVIPGGEPPITRANFTPLTDAYVSYLAGQTGQSPTFDPTTLVRDNSALFTRLINSRTNFNQSLTGFQQYVSGTTGISLDGFNFLTSDIIIGQPSDNALEALRNVNVLSDPSDPDSSLVPFLNADGSVSSAGSNTVTTEAPAVTPADIAPCNAAGNSCGGSAGQPVPITGGAGS